MSNSMPIIITLVAILTCFKVHADYSRADLNDMVSLVHQLDEKPIGTDIRSDLQERDLKLSFFVSQYLKKCGYHQSSKQNCFLFETDVLPKSQARKNRVLMFRGESRVFPMPAVSSLVRNEIEHNVFCDKQCSSLELWQSLVGSVELLSKILNPKNESSLGVYVLLNSRLEWVAKVDSSMPDAPLSTLTIIARNHMEWMQSLFKQTSTGTVSIDPLVSLTADPEVAIRYAQERRLIIASIPLENMVHVSASECQGSNLNLTMIYNFRQCSGTKWDSEQEWNAMLYLPSQYLFRVITGP